VNALVLRRPDLPLFAVGAALTLAAVYSTTVIGDTLALGGLVVLLLFGVVIVAFVAAPHVAVAATIPIFAFLPAAKVLWFPWIGPLKDLITVAAIAAAVALVVRRSGAGLPQRADFWATTAILVLVALYVVNLGGAAQHDVAWMHGTRLIALPLALFVVGMMLDNPQRTLNWAMASLIATAVVVALVGLVQQVVGDAALVSLGYQYDTEVRSVNGRLRSFGTMDEPFTYASFLLLGLSAVIFWMRRGVLAYSVGGLLLLALAPAYVRTALGVLLAFAGLWLARHRHTTVAVLLIGTALVSGVLFLLLAAGATESRQVRTGQTRYLTVNGRTDAWAIVLGDPAAIGFGQGVGEVGTAAERARYRVGERREETAKAVDSGYVATVADVGFVGLSVVLLFLARLFQLARNAARRGVAAGWLALAFLTLFTLDAVTRASFTGFPTAFLTLLLIGLALAAATPSDTDRRAPPRPRAS
jgi:putative inorganic carbon (hco3(-)) transporter